MSYQDIELRTEGPIAYLTLRRPERHNALRALTVSELCEALELAGDDQAVRVVVISAEGKSFCAGADIAELGSGVEAQGEVPPRTLVDLNLAFTRLGKPSIAAVNGAALGGGLMLVTGCHLALAADTANFGTPEVAVGVWPMLVMAGLFRTVGRKAGLRLVLGGQPIAAAEAAQIGLINEVVPAAELSLRSRALAESLAERSPAVMRLGLEAFHAIDGLSFESTLDHLDRQLAAVLGTEDASEGIRAFLEKRKPQFRGR